MIEPNSYLFGVFTGASIVGIFLVIIVIMMRRDLRRVRGRLTHIIGFAKLQGYAWAHRRMTGQDWSDLYDTIAPFEEA